VFGKRPHLDYHTNLGPFPKFAKLIANYLQLKWSRGCKYVIDIGFIRISMHGYAKFATSKLI
jgi:hypothetical protein